MKRLISCLGKEELAEFMEAFRPLLSAVDFKAVAAKAVKAALVVSGAQRACLIIKNKKGKLVLKAGLPECGHALGNMECGSGFLRMMIKNGKYKLVSNPSSDACVGYMKDLVKTYKINSLLFVPLMYKEQDLGILVLDRTDGKRFSNAEIQKSRTAGEYISVAIWREYRRKTHEEDAVRDANLRALGENAAKVAHSLRNPLTGIGGLARRIQKKATAAAEGGKEMDPESILEYCRIIIGDTARMERHIRDVLAFAKISVQRMNLEPVFLDGFLRDTVMSLVKSHPKKMKVRFSIDPRLERVKVKIDASMLKFAFEDIVRNALEAEGSSVLKIKAKVVPANKIAVITFANNGEPIAKEIIEDVFSPFMTTKADGTGLGLASVKAAVKAHRGEVWVERKDDKSARYRTKFKIHLPL